MEMRLMLLAKGVCHYFSQGNLSSSAPRIAQWNFGARHHGGGCREGLAVRYVLEAGMYGTGATMVSTCLSLISI